MSVTHYCDNCKAEITNENLWYDGEAEVVEFRVNVPLPENKYNKVGLNIRIKGYADDTEYCTACIEHLLNNAVRTLLAAA